MKEKMKKLQLKSYVAGFLTCLLFFGSTLAFANTQTVTREITYGVRVNLNGQLMQFDEDARPFVMGGRTFLSVRDIAEAVNLPVHFEPSTNTVYLGNRFAGRRTPLREAAPFFDRSPNIDFQDNWTAVGFHESVTMGGVSFNNPLSFRRSSTAAGTQFTLHNLNGQYRVFSGYMGRHDGSWMEDVTVAIRGDGVLLQSFNLRATDMPTPFSLFVEGVHQLRIEVTFSRDSGRGLGFERVANYAIIGYLE